MSDEPTLYVPIVLTETQAIGTLAAVRAVFQSAPVGILAPPLAQSMVAIAEAIDKARENR